jgi:hypothetical protein
MKQIVLAIMAFFLIISMYAVFTSLQDSGIFTTMEDNQSNSVATAAKTASAKKTTYTAPLTTPKSKRLFLDKTIAAITKGGT